MPIRISLRRWRAVNALKSDCDCYFSYKFENFCQTCIARVIKFFLGKRSSILGLLFPLESAMVSEFCGDEERLSKLTELEEVLELGIVDSRISSTTLDRVALLPNLRYLSLTGSSVIDEYLKVFETMRNLEVLVLTDTQVTGIGLNDISQVLKDCRVIRGTRHSGDAQYR